MVTRNISWVWDINQQNGNVFYARCRVTQASRVNGAIFVFYVLPVYAGCFKRNMTENWKWLLRTTRHRPSLFDTRSNPINSMSKEREQNWVWFISWTFEEQINILNKTCVSKLFTSVVVKGDIFEIITLLVYVVGSSCGSRPKPLFTEFVWEVFRLNSDGSKSQKNGTLLLAVPLEASHWLSQYPTDFGEWNEDTFIPKHSSGGLWKCLSTVREASGVALAS